MAPSTKKKMGFITVEGRGRAYDVRLKINPIPFRSAKKKKQDYLFKTFFSGFSLNVITFKTS